MNRRKLNTGRCQLWLLWCFLSLPMAVFAQGQLVLTLEQADTSRPISGATISLFDDEKLITALSTDELGKVRFSELPAGIYQAEVRKTGFFGKRLFDLRIVNKRLLEQTIQLARANDTLEEIVVVAKAQEVNDTGSVGASYLNRESLRSAAGSGSDVLRALDGMPGLFSSGEFASFTVRGRGPRDNLILVDGIPFANVIHFNESFGEQEELDGGGRYSVFAPNLIEGARFEPGGWGASQGGPAGALLELDVAKASLEDSTYTLRLDLAGIELGYEGPSKILDNTSVLFSARQLDFGRVFETIGEDDIGQPELTDVIVKTVSELSDTDTLSALVIYAPESYYRDINNVLASDEEGVGDFVDVELVDSESNSQLMSLHWQRLVGESGEWNNRLYYRYYDEQTTSGEAYPEQVELGAPIASIPLDDNILFSERDETSLGLRTQYDDDNRFGRFTTGLDMEHLDASATLRLNRDWQRFIYDQNDFRENNDQRFIVLTPDQFNNEYDDSGLISALYFEQNIDVGNAKFRLGLRAESDSFSEQTVLLPRAGLNWQLNTHTRLTTTLGRYQQMLEQTTRAADDENRRLENEQVDQFSVGIEHLVGDNYELFAETYYQRQTNLVVDGDRVSRISNNTGKGRSYGIDTAVTRRFDNGWSANMNYSFNQSQEKDCRTCDYIDTDFHRTHSFSVGGIWQINSRWKLSSRWKWASGTPTDSFIVHSNVLGEVEPLRYSKEIVANNDLRYDAFHSLNFRVDYQRSLGATEMILFFDVINAYGAENPSSADFNERSGENEVEEGSAFPIFGIRFTW